MVVINLLLTLPAQVYAQTQTTTEQKHLQAAAVAVRATYPNAVQPQHLIYEAKPGQTLEDYVTLTNIGDADSINAYLYGADSDKTAEGNIAFKTKADKMEKVGTWISFDQTNMTFKPKEEKQVKVTIAIPAGATSGDYVGGIAVESLQPSRDGVNIALRYVMQVKIKVTENPQHIPKIGETNVFAPKPAFWIAAIIFLTCSLYFIRERRKEKRSKEPRS